MADAPAPEYHSGSDPRSLRDALGTFATGVTVVTTLSPDGEPVGLTANSFTSVSLEPPLLLVCPARSATTTAALEVCDHFAINVLESRQEAVSTLFATKGTERFEGTEFETWDHDVPILRDALASFECRKYALHEGGDHLILVGEIVRARYATHGDPLLYFRSRYSRLQTG
ncbi:MAG: flavin reductase family protein [Pseudomonadota bacterium]